MIVIFNIGSTDFEVLTDDHAFIKNFFDIEEAKKEANEWIDGTQYRSFEIFKTN